MVFSLKARWVAGSEGKVSRGFSGTYSVRQNCWLATTYPAGAQGVSSFWHPRMVKKTSSPGRRESPFRRAFPNDTALHSPGPSPAAASAGTSPWRSTCPSFWSSQEKERSSKEVKKRQLWRRYSWRAGSLAWKSKSRARGWNSWQEGWGVRSGSTIPLMPKLPWLGWSPKSPP